MQVNGLDIPFPPRSSSTTAEVGARHKLQGHESKQLKGPCEVATAQDPPAVSCRCGWMNGGIMDHRSPLFLLHVPVAPNIRLCRFCLQAARRLLSKGCVQGSCTRQTLASHPALKVQAHHHGNHLAVSSGSLGPVAWTTCLNPERSIFWSSSLRPAEQIGLTFNPNNRKSKVCSVFRAAAAAPRPPAL